MPRKTAWIPAAWESGQEGMKADNAWGGGGGEIHGCAWGADGAEWVRLGWTCSGLIGGEARLPLQAAATCHWTPMDRPTFGYVIEPSINVPSFPPSTSSPRGGHAGETGEQISLVSSQVPCSLQPNSTPTPTPNGPLPIAKITVWYEGHHGHELGQRIFVTWITPGRLDRPLPATWSLRLLVDRRCHEEMKMAMAMTKWTISKTKVQTAAILLRLAD
ncbi:hypothetical protein B0T17DRAFT_505774 [Bombardia bombarda]|uniref:Uncharacterized protein n=1 Tax=Bombardia bombarda TaxID=252184 RepID=A0AA39X8L4_9PEZI|nr:hypothetical protein B0T17DRAFT_505774 [Bombardia bombarda]